MTRSSLLLLRYQTPRASPSTPLAFLEPPGPALLHRNLSWLSQSTNCSHRELQRIATSEASPVYVHFDAGSSSRGLADCALLHQLGVPLVAVRGRRVPREARGLFHSIWLGDGLLPLLENDDAPLPNRWAHPLVLAHVFSPDIGPRALGVVFSCMPEPGLLELSELGGAGLRQGVAPAALPQELTHDELSDLIHALERHGAKELLFVDCGGDSAGLADRLLDLGRLAAWFGPARRPIPGSVAAAGVARYTWFEPEDLLEPSLASPASSWGCAFVPVGLPGLDVPTTTAQLLGLRDLGFDVVVPRFFNPEPNTPEWRQMTGAHRLRPHALAGPSESRLSFDLPGWEPADGSELLDLWRRGNRWPSAASPGRRGSSPTYSLAAVRHVLKGYVGSLGDAGADATARDLVRELFSAAGGTCPDVTSLESYPFFAINGRNALDVVNEALDRRLLSVLHSPASLREALRHTPFAGGKRIRPLMMLAITCARGVVLEAALPAALALEWLHAASLIQDDLPCMDNEPLRRGAAAAHVRHGEGLAVLAADGLVSLAFEDIAASGRHPWVGSERAVVLVEKMARALGSGGMAGGQALDLMAREGGEIDIDELVRIHLLKTAPLFELAGAFAVTLAKIEDPLASRLVEVLVDTGLAFQVADDLLDRTADGRGRRAGSDARNGAPSFLDLMEEREARRYLQSLVAPAAALFRSEPTLGRLAHLVRFVVERPS